MPEMGPLGPAPAHLPPSPHAVAVTRTQTPGMCFGAENAHGQPGLSTPSCAPLHTSLSGRCRDVPADRGTRIAWPSSHAPPAKCAQPLCGRYCSGNHFYTTYSSDRPVGIKMWINSVAA